jgi:hypothetical protein
MTLFTWNLALSKIKLSKILAEDPGKFLKSDFSQPTCIYHIYVG